MRASYKAGHMAVPDHAASSIFCLHRRGRPHMVPHILVQFGSAVKGYPVVKAKVRKVEHAR